MSIGSGNIQKVMELLVRELGIDPSKEVQLLLLTRACEYADTSTYSPEPKTNDEKIYNEIFFVKAKCYFKRKQVEMSMDHQTAKSIQEYEYREVHLLRANLTLTHT